jgi:hypothetical protein
VETYSGGHMIGEHGFIETVMDDMVTAVTLDHPDGEAESQRDCDNGPE